MKNLLLNWTWFNEDGTPGAYLWAICILVAVVVFATIIFLIYRLYGRNFRKNSTTTQLEPSNTQQVQPVEFEKREDNQKLDFYDPEKAKEEAAELERAQAEKQRQEEERLHALMLEEERKRKDLEARERAFEEKKQRDEEARIEFERQAEERIAEKERQADERIAEKERKSSESQTSKNNANNFFFDNNEEDATAFSFGDDTQTDSAVDFWSQAKTISDDKPVAPVIPVQTEVNDPRLDKLMEELEIQKQAEQERFANLMAELEQQKQETARLQGELEGKNKSENLIEQAKKEMEQMIKDSQDRINTLENEEKKNKDDNDLLQQIKNVLAVEREAQEQRLREQENSLAAVLNAIENERRVKEENALNAEQESKKENEFIKMQNQYQDAIAQMQAKFQQMLDDANAQKQVAPANTLDHEAQNVYQLQLERERAQTANLIEQMQQEVDRLNAEREAERQQYEEKQKALNVTLAEALQTQRKEFEQAQQRVAETNMSNVEKILQDIERQRAQEQEMFNNILNQMVAEREDNLQTKAALEQMVRESEARIQKLENQTMPRGLDEESIASLKEVLASEREEQFKRMEEYKAEIANLRDTIESQRKHEEDDDANQVVYTARETEVDEEMKARMDAMQNEIQYLNELRENERAESEKRHAELLETLNRSIAANENTIVETQDVERENTVRSDESARIEMLMNELAESREDTRRAQEAMQQLIQESSDLINQLNNQKDRGVNEETMSVLKELLAQERDMQEKRLAEHEDRLNLAVSTIEEQKQNQTEEEDKNAKYEQIIADMRAEYETQLNALRETIANQTAVEEAQSKVVTEDDDNGEEIEFNANQGANEEVLAQLERLQSNINSLEEARNAEKAEFEQRYVELNKALEDSLKVQRLEMELEKERELNEYKMQQALAAQRQEIETASEQELAAQREAIEEEKAQALAEMRKSMEASKEQEINAHLEAMKAEKEQELAERLEALKMANEKELAAEREAFEAVKEQELSELEALKVASEQEIAAQREAIEEEKAQALAELRKSFEASKEQEITAQLEAMKTQKEQELAAEREAFEAVKEQELAELEALKVASEQEIAAQREAIEEEKQRVALEQADVNEQANAIIASFKEEMNRQYEEFLTSMKEKKEEAENLKKEYEQLIEQSSPEDQAILKEQYDVQEVMEQLREERKAAREEAQALREELEAQRMETEAKLMKQLSEVKEGLVSELSSELEIKEKFDAMEREIEAQNQEKLKQNEEEEARIKQEYEEFKKRIADEVVALEEKNAALQAELEMARAEKTSDDETKQAEYEENEKRLREKYMQLRNELMKEAEQVTKQSEEIAAEKQMIEDKKKDLEEEKLRLQNEVAMLKQQVLEIKTQDGNQEGVVTEEQLAEVRASLEAEYQQREKEMLDKLEVEKQSLVAREAQLKLKESHIEKEEERIREQSKAVTTMITNREYTKEERERMVLDYSLKLQDLEDRLRQNEKALRENNREFIPLRRIKNTLDRDLRLLRKREAIVAKQEVLVYGVNNISTVDPERIKKLEQDIKQLSGLQQSVANCETILNKNKDRYPTLENLDRVLRAQNEQIRRDLEEVKSAMAMFGDGNEGEEVAE